MPVYPGGRRDTVPGVGVIRLDEELLFANIKPTVEAIEQASVLVAAGAIGNGSSTLPTMAATPWETTAFRAGLAQLAEHLSCKEDVTGSSPVPGSKSWAKPWEIHPGGGVGRVSSEEV